MKIQLPNSQRIELDETLCLEEKLKIVEDLSCEWHDTITDNWDSQPIRYFLDGLANYIVWHKEDVYKQDKEVLSIWKVEQLSNKRKNNSIPFSSLPREKKELLGIDTNNDFTSE